MKIRWKISMVICTNLFQDYPYPHLSTIQSTHAYNIITIRNRTSIFHKYHNITSPTSTHPKPHRRAPPSIQPSYSSTIRDILPSHTSYQRSVLNSWPQRHAHKETTISGNGTSIGQNTGKTAWLDSQGYVRRCMEGGEQSGGLYGGRRTVGGGGLVDAFTF